METGIIVKGIGGFYYVSTSKGIIECRARGNFRKKNMSPAVGDKVDISIISDGKGTVDHIHPRKNIFIRPPVSNIDEMFIVCSVANPMPDTTFIDKMLIICHSLNVKTSICFNKCDLLGEDIDDIIRIYKDIGYDVYFTSTVDGIGIDTVRGLMNNRITAFAGFSGVGKSSLLNAVMENDIMETGDVSERLKRGRHTTRHVELISNGDGYIVDTPGFSMLDFSDEITKDNLKDYFPEFSQHECNCRFRGCNHIASKDVCAVSNAVEEGRISLSRYNNYTMFYKQLSERKEWKK